MQLHTLQGYIQNIFLVEYPHGCLLLDGACKADFETIENYFKQILKRPLSDLKAVIVTHMHPDHAGCAHYLRKQTGCKIISGDFSKQWYAGVSGRVTHLLDIYLALWVAKRLGKTRRNIWYSPTLRPDLKLPNNARVPGFEDWQIIASPGHTSMDISLLNEEHKLLYVADLVVKVKGEFSPPFPVSLPDQYKRSVSKLKNHTDCEILMAHVAQQHINNDDIDHILALAPHKPQNNRQILFDMAKKLARFRS